MQKNVIELLEVINEMAGELVDLVNAEIIVSGGRGVGGPEGFAPVRELAEVLRCYSRSIQSSC